MRGDSPGALGCLEGYLLAGESTRAASSHALDPARKHGTKIAYSFSDGFLVANFGEHVKYIVTTYADLVFANELRAAAYTGRRDPQASRTPLSRTAPMLSVPVVKMAPTSTITVRLSMFPHLPHSQSI